MRLSRTSLVWGLTLLVLGGLLLAQNLNLLRAPVPFWAVMFGGLGLLFLLTVLLVIPDLQAIAFSVNTAAAIFFIFTGNVVWPAALVMAVFALIGGALGGKLAGKIKPGTLRWLVVVIGVVVAIIYFIRG